MLMRLAVVAVAVALSAGAWSSGALVHNSIEG